MKISPNIISFVARSKRRKEVLLKLQKNSISQPELKKLTGMYKAHTSRTLSELLEKKLILCRNPGDRVFKFYKITSLGSRTIKEIERIRQL